MENKFAKLHDLMKEVAHLRKTIPLKCEELYWEHLQTQLPKLPPVEQTVLKLPPPLKLDRDPLHGPRITIQELQENMDHLDVKFKAFKEMQEMRKRLDLNETHNVLFQRRTTCGIGTSSAREFAETSTPNSSGRLDIKASKQKNPVGNITPIETFSKMNETVTPESACNLEGTNLSSQGIYSSPQVTDGYTDHTTKPKEFTIVSKDRKSEVEDKKRSPDARDNVEMMAIPPTSKAKVLRTPPSVKKVSTSGQVAEGTDETELHDPALIQLPDKIETGLCHTDHTPIRQRASSLLSRVSPVRTPAIIQKTPVDAWSMAVRRRRGGRLASTPSTLNETSPKRRKMVTENVKTPLAVGSPAIRRYRSGNTPNTPGTTKEKSRKGERS